jgi:hypothetical protein
MPAKLPDRCKCCETKQCASLIPRQAPACSEQRRGHLCPLSSDQTQSRAFATLMRGNDAGGVCLMNVPGIPPGQADRVHWWDDCFLRMVRRRLSHDALARGPIRGANVHVVVSRGPTHEEPRDAARPCRRGPTKPILHAILCENTVNELVVLHVAIRACFRGLKMPAKQSDYCARRTPRHRRRCIAGIAYASSIVNRSSGAPHPSSS